MKKHFLFFLLIILAFPLLAHAQEETLEVNFTRDWGYGGGAGEIQGQFSLRVTGPEDLVEVHFMIDNTLMTTLVEPPFDYQFSTDAYPPGPHTLTVVGILSDGTQLLGPEFKRVFLSAEKAKEETIRLMVPILVGVGGIILLAALVPLIFSRKNAYQLGKYGLAGGAVCTRCHLPFSRNLISPNLFAGKLECCPHCGKWAIVRAASSQELTEAEKRYTEGETKVELGAHAQSEKWKKSLDDTRYE